ncbi:MAG: glycosyltransferase family 2 protein [Butyrivibrio sp.]|uniref:glycosyltransferase family 2 protein n=1 Tax=Butyrivibrio sp. TaxID=28121 RepID=UPI0025E597E4|nr:glycosyltransferase family 2 protein [Butyrivibrio sp.]MCR5773195.1 glycosyltransferase family 2 protein [Butyrivibrio sp.]
MITFSLCMIVRNEEKNLKRCLDCLKDLMDEMIIVDTGSTDSTKEIAVSYGAKVYDFKWIDDFAAARNFAFSKAGCDYIYSADADEAIDDANILEFKKLKKVLGEDTTDTPIDIVQMYYCGQTKGKEKSVYNFDKELRPKLFKRIRHFVWENPIHEQIRTEPLIYDSDIEIQHMQSESHASRDLSIFRKAIDNGYTISSKLLDFYARELYMAGTSDDLTKAREFMAAVTDSEMASVEDIRKASIILARYARLKGDIKTLLKYALKEVSSGCASEMCCELGDYYMDNDDPLEASLWYYNAAFEQKPMLDIHTGADRPLIALSKCYEKLGNKELSDNYLKMAKETKI